MITGPAGERLPLTAVDYFLAAADFFLVTPEDDLFFVTLFLVTVFLAAVFLVAVFLVGVFVDAAFFVALAADVFFFAAACDFTSVTAAST